MSRHLLAAGDLSRAEATAILDDADRFAQALVGREVRKLPTLRGRTVITMFYENSTRTRVSFEVAGKWMSADVINVSAAGSSVGKGESLRDTALTCPNRRRSCWCKPPPPRLAPPWPCPTFDGGRRWMPSSSQSAKRYSGSIERPLPSVPERRCIYLSVTSCAAYCVRPLSFFAV